MIKFAVIGRNFIVDWFLEAASEFPEFFFRGVYSRAKETAAEYAALKGAERIYTSINELCKDDELDMVYIASPNICHEEQAIALLNAKKHVLCEKPAAISAEGLSRMLETAEKNGRVFMEAMVPLHMPAFEEVRRLLPELGKIRHAEFSFCQYSSRYDRFKNNIMTNTFDPALGNGSLMDLGIYCVHFLLALFGMPQKIHTAAEFIPGSIDASGAIAAAYPDMTASLVYSKVCDSLNLSQIMGEDGCLLIDKVSRPKKLTLKKRGGDAKVIDLTPTRHEMAYEIQNFIRQINGEKMPQFNEISKLAMNFCDIARAEAGIDFKKERH